MWYTKSGRRTQIPGVTGAKVPGRASLPRMVGKFMTNVPVMDTSSMFREAHRQQVRNSGRFAGGWGYAWQGLAELADAIEDFQHETEDSIERATRELAEEMLDYAKRNAPWQDHPGKHEDARDNLQAAVVKTAEGWSIYLGHGRSVHYGIWLEVRWGGAFAILYPTLVHFAPRYADKVRTMT